MSIGITPLTANIGAEISGLNLSEPLDAETQLTLKTTWMKHGVLVFRNQELTPAEQVRFTRCFGEPKVHWLKDSLLPEQPEIMRVSNVLENGRHIGVYNAGRFWHSDLSYVDQPDRAGILFALEIPKRGGVSLGNTLYASTSAAYQELDDNTKLLLEGLEARFSVARRNENLEIKADTRTVPSSEQKSSQCAIHPVVRIHPETSRKCLYVSEGHTDEICGLAAAEGRVLINGLVEHLTQPRFVYTHKWQPGDVVMWDNITTQHKATFDYELPQRRLLHRTTIAACRILPNSIDDGPDENRSDAEHAE